MVPPRSNWVQADLKLLRRQMVPVVYYILEVKTVGGSTFQWQKIRFASGESLETAIALKQRMNPPGADGDDYTLMTLWTARFNVEFQAIFWGHVPAISDGGTV